MPFLDGTPDMRRTAFSEKELAWARTYLVNSITFLDPTWLEHPAGPIGEYWASDGDHSASYLVHLAYVWRGLDSATNKSSMPTLHEKLRKILRPSSSKSYEEDL